MITTDPGVPTADKAVKIIYDSSKDSGDLNNSTGDLYAHTGVFIQGTSGWQKVIGVWGNNVSQPKLKYLGNFKYELDITPDLKTFYSLSSSDIVTKIALVIRNGQSTKQTKPDIFIDIFQSGLNVIITSPARNSIVADLNKQIAINAVSTLADSVSLYINGVFIKSGSAPNQLTYTFTASQYGEFRIKTIAWDKPLFKADSFYVYVPSPITTEALPAGLNDGINYTGNSSVTLVLNAPYKKYAFVTGDFTTWLPGDKGYMKKTPDGERYWREFTALIPGKEYRYQYMVDTSLYIADPYSDKVLDPDNDSFISSDTYPNLIKYPKDTASGIVSVLQTAQVPYNWKTTGFTPPPKSKLVIYEVLVRDFTAKHNYKTLIDSLSYLDDLGINAIELMPVTEFEGNISWGYNDSFYFAPDKYYGSKNDLKALIDSCHNRGIAVIMDLVLNHTFGQSPFVQLYVDSYGTDQIFMKTPNPWFNASSPNPTYKWGADFNHESADTKKLVDRITSYWLSQYKMDGFRFDFTKGFTNTPGEGNFYDSYRIAILKRIADKIWQVKPEAYVILEHFTPNSEEKELADYGLMIWGNNNHNYCEAAMGYDSDLSAVSSQNRGWNDLNLVSYMESHDEERVMFKNITYGASADDYNIKDLNTALKRMRLAAVFFLTVPGPKMIWQFGELGYDISIDENGRTGEKPIKWDYYTVYERKQVYNTYKILNYLKKTYPVFTNGVMTSSLSSPQKKIQLSSPEMKVNILGNFGLAQAQINPSFEQTGWWYEYFSGDSVNVTDVSSQISLEAGEYRLYTSKKLPAKKLILGTEEHLINAEEISVNIYPNPVRVGCTIEIKQKNYTPSEISISDIYGRAIVKENIKPTGGSSELFEWDGRNSNGTVAPGGIYLVNVKTSSGSKTSKLIKL
jgi:glycosidase